MASQSQLDTLIDLAQRASDDAAKRLGVALKAVADAEQKKVMLVGYRDDDAQRRGKGGVAGKRAQAHVLQDAQQPRRHRGAETGSQAGPEANGRTRDTAGLLQTLNGDAGTNPAGSIRY